MITNFHLDNFKAFARHNLNFTDYYSLEELTRKEIQQAAINAYINKKHRKILWGFAVGFRNHLFVFCICRKA